MEGAGRGFFNLCWWVRSSEVSDHLAVQATGVREVLRLDLTRATVSLWVFGRYRTQVPLGVTAVGTRAEEEGLLSK